MIALAFFAISAIVSALLWTGLEPTFRSAPVLQRRNYRGHELPVASGVVVVLAAALVGGVYTLQVRYGGWSPGELRRGATVGGAALGFGFLGLVDDLLEGSSRKGFRGHIGAVRHGEITTGLVKLVFGVLFGMLLVGLDLHESIRGGIVVAAAANLANLFDRAPGRVIKVSLIGAVLVAALGAPGWHLTGPMLIVGAGLGLLVPDLRERCMLGDTGSNVLGAAVGWGLVLSLGSAGEWVALAVLVGLNVISEFVSFTRVIDAVAPLRWLDRLGTLPERRSYDATIRAASAGPTI
jgi:UDP-GlcNAc:undecaprenyl-phosphate GlcNAc-1-phosphate transferase